MKPDLISLAPLPAKPMASLAEDFAVHPMPLAAERAALLRDVGDQVRFLQSTGFTAVDANLIAALPRLEIVGHMGVGVDSVDIKAAKARNIIVTNTPDVLNDCVADLAIGLVIAAARRLIVADRFVRARQWLSGPMPFAAKVGGKRVGILGLGRIGKAIAKRARAFDMKIGYHGRSRQPVRFRYFESLVGLARWSDFLVVICPGGEATRNLVDAKVLEALGPKGTLVNVARGSVVDEAALVAALKDGRLGGAALDVFLDEPRVPEELMGMDNVVLMPHVGSATVETRNAMGDLVVANLRAHLRGEKLPSRYC